MQIGDTDNAVGRLYLTPKVINANQRKYDIHGLSADKVTPRQNIQNK